MKGSRRHGPAAVIATCMIAVLAACGTAEAPRGGSGPSAGHSVSIGVLLPDTSTPRWETADKPLIEKDIKAQCGNCTVRYANASGDVAAQQAQVDSMIANGVEAIILCPVESKALRPSVTLARESNVAVVSYDRLADGPVAAYSGYDSQRIGRLQAEGLLSALGPNAHRDQIIMMNGEPTDPNAKALRQGALSVLQGRVKIGAAYNTTGWIPQNAFTNTLAAVAKLGQHGIDGVYAANDGLATGSLTALKADAVNPVPPITGQDADLDAVQRVVAGEQTVTVYKSFAAEAAAAAAMALALARGEPVEAIAKQRVSNDTDTNIPAYLGTPVPVNRANVKQAIVDPGVYTVQQICTPKVQPACREAGLIG